MEADTKEYVVVQHLAHFALVKKETIVMDEDSESCFLLRKNSMSNLSMANDILGCLHSPEVYSRVASEDCFVFDGIRMSQYVMMQRELKGFRCADVVCSLDSHGQITEKNATLYYNYGQNYWEINRR